MEAKAVAVFLTNGRNLLGAWIVMKKLNLKNYRAYGHYLYFCRKN